MNNLVYAVRDSQGNYFISYKDGGNSYYASLDKNWTSDLTKATLYRSIGPARATATREGRLLKRDDLIIVTIQLKIVEEMPDKERFIKRKKKLEEEERTRELRRLEDRKKFLYKKIVEEQKRIEDEERRLK